MEANIAVFGILRFPPENIEKVLPHLNVLVRETYEHDGCIAYDVALDPFDKGLIRFSELWPNKTALHRHLTAAHIEPWRQQAKKHGLIEREFHAYDLSSGPVVI